MNIVSIAFVHWSENYALEEPRAQQAFSRPNKQARETLGLQSQLTGFSTISLAGGDPNRFQFDLANLTALMAPPNIVKAGVIVMDRGIAGVLPVGESVPSNVVYLARSNSLQNYAEDFDTIREGVDPELVLITIDNGGSKADFGNGPFPYTERLQYGLTRFLDYLEANFASAVVKVRTFAREPWALNEAGRIALVGSHALVCSPGNDLIATVNVADPTDPYVADTLKDEYMIRPKAPVIDGEFMYLAECCEPEGGVSIFDLHNPDKPRRVSSVFSEGMALASALAKYGNYAYVTSPETNTLSVVDVSDPGHPIVVGTLTDAVNLNYCHAITILFPHCYIAAQNNRSIATVDVTDPQVPVLASSVLLDNGFDASFPETVNIMGDILVVGAFYSTSRSLHTFSLSVPSTPSQIAFEFTGALFSFGDGHMAISGTMAFMAAERFLIVWDLSDPYDPTVIVESDFGINIFMWTAMVLNDSTIYLCNEDSQPYYNTADPFDNLICIDVSTPSSPLYICSINSGVLRGGIGAAMYAGHLYITTRYTYPNSPSTIDRSAIVVMDISVPVLPSMIDAILHRGIDSPSGVSVSGSFAAVVGGAEITILNVSDADNALIQTAMYQVQATIHRDCAWSGTTLYAISEFSSGGIGDIRAYDISDGNHLTLLGQYGSFAILGGLRCLKLNGNVAWIAGTSNRLVSIDITDPAAMYVVGTLADASSSIVDLAISGGYAYLADSSGGRLFVVDINIPANPTVVATYSAVGKTNGAAGVAISGNTLFLAAGGNGVVSCLDIADPANPTELGFVVSNKLAGASKVAVSGNYAYVTAATANCLCIIDVSNPAAPLIVGTTQRQETDRYLNEMALQLAVNL